MVLDVLKTLYGAIGEQPDAVINFLAAKKLELLKQDIGQEGSLSVSEELMQLLANLMQCISHNHAPPCDGWIIDAWISNTTSITTIMMMLFNGVGVTKMLQFWQAMQVINKQDNYHAATLQVMAQEF